MEVEIRSKGTVVRNSFSKEAENTLRGTKTRPGFEDMGWEVIGDKLGPDHEAK